MALKNKPKRTAASRKRQALHHRRSKNYIKPYLPYLPMAAIVAGGGIINAIWSAGTAVAAADSLQPTVASTRLASLTGASAGVIYIALAVTFAAFAFFVATHWYRFHRLFNRGEAFAARYPLLDIALVFVITAGVVLTRTN